jgi:hypothetical protein
MEEWIWGITPLTPAQLNNYEAMVAMDLLHMSLRCAMNRISVLVQGEGLIRAERRTLDEISTTCSAKIECVKSLRRAHRNGEVIHPVTWEWIATAKEYAAHVSFTLQEMHATQVDRQLCQAHSRLILETARVSPPSPRVRKRRASQEL